MKRDRAKVIAFVLLIAAVLVLRFTVFGEYISFSRLKENSGVLWRYVDAHYYRAVAVFIALYLSTAFFLPGTLVLTIAGGFLFGALPGALYATAGALLGSSLAFFSARYLAGNWVHEKYRFHLSWLNEEIRKNGPLYLLTLRVLPFAPFFLVNFLAGLSGTPYRTFLWTTLVGMCPGAAAFSFAGQQLRTLSSLQDIFSPGFILALALMTLLLLGPILWKKRQRENRERQSKTG
ncbi:MAG: TVP38/TMEM64 family protein [Thermodesulfovibrionales bacterium]